MVLPALNPAPTELTTAATDGVLAVLCIAAVAWLTRRLSPGPRRDTWQGILVLLGAGALLGAVSHGWLWGEVAGRRIWAGVLLCLSLASALFPGAALLELRGAGAQRRLAPWMIAGGLGAFAASQWSGGGLTVLLAFAGVAAAATLLLFLLHAVRGREPGAWVAVAGLVVHFLATGVQVQGTARLTLVWPLDHNGICHLIQMVGLALMVWGVAWMAASEVSRRSAGASPGAVA